MTASGTKTENSAGVIVYCIDERGEPRFLLLRYATYWGFTKGLVEKGENLDETAKREVKEETGLENINIIDGFVYEQKWFFRAEGRLVSKRATFFLACVGKGEADKVKISSEHEDFKWLGYEDAVCLMKIKNNKEMIKSAYEFIKEHEKQKVEA